jgi:hypothetical protein
MASKRGGSKAKSGGGAKAGKRKPNKGGLKDLEAKDGRKIRGGTKQSVTEEFPFLVTKLSK